MILRTTLAFTAAALSLGQARAADLVTPPMTHEAPAAGKRVWQQAPEYRDTDVYHSLYLPQNYLPQNYLPQNWLPQNWLPQNWLPQNWLPQNGLPQNGLPGKKYPVLVEYTGNKFPPGKGSGEVKDANLGYGISGGSTCIWVVMPFIAMDKKHNEVTWWGDRQSTIDYCKQNVPRICEEFGGDPENLLICGFSRGAIATSYIGLADDEIARLWKAVMTHDHFDGAKQWPYPDSNRQSAVHRLSRLRGRPVLVCGQHATGVRIKFLGEHLDLAAFTFLDIPVDSMFSIPEGPYLHSHTDLWMHRQSIYRDQVRTWIQKVVKNHSEQ